jgi:hypothetical protein
MRYDDIFSKPIEECSDDEIRARAMEMRKDAKLTRGKKKAAKVEGETSAELAETKGKTNKTGNMLEQLINNAKKTSERAEGEAN